MKIISEPFFSIHLSLLKNYSESFSFEEEKVFVKLMQSDIYDSYLKENKANDPHSEVLSLLPYDKQSEFIEDECKKNGYQAKERASLWKIHEKMSIIYKDLNMPQIVLSAFSKATSRDMTLKDAESFVELVGYKKTLPELSPPGHMSVYRITKSLMNKIHDEYIKESIEAEKNGHETKEEEGIVVICKQDTTKSDFIKYFKSQWENLGMSSKKDKRKNSTLYEKLLISKFYEEFNEQKKRDSDTELKSAGRYVQVALEEEGIIKSVNTIEKAYKAITDM